MKPRRSQVHPKSGRKTLNRSAVLRKVMTVLSVRGFADTSITELTKATGVDWRILSEAFGKKNEIVASAIRFCAESETCLAHEALRTSHSGKEAITCMLEENVRLCGRWPKLTGCLFTLNAFIIPTKETGLQDFLTEQRRALARQLRARLIQSVGERELPEQTNVDVVTELCLTVLGGLTFRVIDGTPKTLLFRSIQLFVNTLGFFSQTSGTPIASKSGRHSEQ